MDVEMKVIVATKVAMKAAKKGTIKMIDAGVTFADVVLARRRTRKCGREEANRATRTDRQTDRRGARFAHLSLSLRAVSLEPVKGSKAGAPRCTKMNDNGHSSCL